jgi:transposase
VRRHDSATWRAYRLKEALRAIVTARDLAEDTARQLIARRGSWAQRSRLAPFVRLARTVRAHVEEILATIRLGLNNGRVEGLNNRDAHLSGTCSEFP